ncbi:MAG: hypothetical protein Q8P46_11965 [Hyphomicrobiales bacterium]|nr:hypothetical protein [Hyphomicrobiales bacterium]
MSRKVYCGVPWDDCSGQLMTLNAAWTPDSSKNKGSGKLHSTNEEAFRCYCRHLQAKGYERIGKREFTLNGGPVLVIAKPSRFGASFRGGKESDKTKSRFTPMNGRGAIVEKFSP